MVGPTARRPAPPPPVPARSPQRSLALALLWVACIGALSLTAFPAVASATQRGPEPRLTPPLLGTPQPEVGPRALEQRWGIEIVRLAVSADGSRVELAFQVLDPRLAQALARDVPSLVVPGTGAVLAPDLPMQGSLQQPGERCSLSYPNPGGAVWPGSLVSVAIGGVRLHPLQVR